MSPPEPGEMQNPLDQVIHQNFPCHERGGICERVGGIYVCTWLARMVAGNGSWQGKEQKERDKAKSKERVKKGKEKGRDKGKSKSNCVKGKSGWWSETVPWVLWTPCWKWRHKKGSVSQQQRKPTDGTWSNGAKAADDCID